MKRLYFLALGVTGIGTVMIYMNNIRDCRFFAIVYGILVVCFCLEKIVNLYLDEL
jgi:hypothetical protein